MVPIVVVVCTCYYHCFYSYNFLLVHLDTQYSLAIGQQHSPTKSWLLSCKWVCPSAGAGWVLLGSWSTWSDASLMFLSAFTWCHRLSLKGVRDCTVTSQGPFPTSKEKVTSAEPGNIRVVQINSQGRKFSLEWTREKHHDSFRMKTDHNSDAYVTLSWLGGQSKSVSLKKKNKADFNIFFLRIYYWSC